MRTRMFRKLYDTAAGAFDNAVGVIVDGLLAPVRHEELAKARADLQALRELQWQSAETIERLSFDYKLAREELNAMRPHVERILSLLVAAGLVECGSVTVSDSGRPPPPPQASAFRPLSEAGLPTMAPWLETGKDAWSRIQVNCPSTDIGGYATVDNCGWILEADDIMVRGTETGAAAREIIDSHLLIAGWCLQKGQT